MVLTNQTALVFRIDPKLLQHRPPRLTLAATLETLGKRVDSGELVADLVVDILDENRLLPYIISDTRNLYTVSLGQLTNASKIGDIIASEECIKGTYELCLSFLKFVLIVLRQRTYVDSSRTMLASVTYIANEIYPNHHIWTYRCISDMYDILSHCTDIFYQIIVKGPYKHGLSASFNRTEVNHDQQDQRCKDLSDLEIVSIINLSQNQAHKQLLDVIVDGRQTIKKILSDETYAEEQTLQDVPTVIYVRQSLSIFDKLLARCQFVKSQHELMKRSPHDKDTDQTSTMTTIEKALFDTSIRPGLLQHLFSYVYQKEDNKTACLATVLIKRIAEKFSMSLMSCLGSEADRVCEFFIRCLDGKETNTDLVIAIVDLLTTCVRHQPGLIELFLNFKRDPTNNQATSKDKMHSETILVVLNLLKQCQAKQEDSYRNLHANVMKLILTFWQKSHSAIEHFDKADDFWELITFPLFRFLNSKPIECDNTIYTSTEVILDKPNSYAFMILARELFNVNAGITERKLNPKLKENLDKLNNENIMSKYSDYVMKRYSSIESNLAKSEDYNRILVSWRDFLASYSKYKPFEISSGVKSQIVKDLLKCLTNELELAQNLNKERVASIGDMLLLLWLKWIDRESINDEVFNSINELIFLTNITKEHLPFSFMLTFQTTLNLYLVRNRDYLMQSKRTYELLEPAMQMMQFSLKIMEKYLNEAWSRLETIDYKQGVESRLCHACITTFRFIISIAQPYVQLWISFVHTNLQTDALVQFLSVLMPKRIGPDVCLALIELLVSLASIQQTADYLNRSTLLGQVNMISASAYEQAYTHLSQLAYRSSSEVVPAAAAVATASVATTNQSSATQAALGTVPTNSASAGSSGGVTPSAIRAALPIGANISQLPINNLIPSEAPISSTLIGGQGSHKTMNSFGQQQLSFSSASSFLISASLENRTNVVAKSVAAAVGASPMGPPPPPPPALSTASNQAPRSVIELQVKQQEQQTKQQRPERQPQAQQQQSKASARSVLSDNERTFLDNQNSNLDWIPIYQQVLRLNIEMILTLGNDYITTAIDFLSIHCIRICELIESLRVKSKSVDKEEVLQSLYLMNQVLRHGGMWFRCSPQTYEAISDEMAKTSSVLIIDAASSQSNQTITIASGKQQPSSQVQEKSSCHYKHSAIFQRQIQQVASFVLLSFSERN